MSCFTSSLSFLIFPDPFLFSKRPSFHHRFLLPLLDCFCFLHPVPLSVALSLSSFFLFSLIVVSFSLLLYLSPSLSLRCPPAFSVQLLILSDFTRRTLYKRWVLFWTWSRTASFHTLQTPLSRPKEFRAAFRERLPGASKSPHIAKKKNHTETCREVVTRSWRRPPSIISFPSFSLLNLALLLPPPRAAKGAQERESAESGRTKSENERKEKESFLKTIAFRRTTKSCHLLKYWMDSLIPFQMKGSIVHGVP